MTNDRRSIWAGLTRAVRAFAERACRLAVSLARAPLARRQSGALTTGGAGSDDARAVGSATAATHEPSRPRALSLSDHLLLPEVECVEVQPDFGERLYPTVFDLLQLGPRCKVLDLRAARALRIDLFERLAAAWQVPPGTVPKLAIVLGYESWAVLHDANGHVSSISFSGGFSISSSVNVTAVVAGDIRAPDGLKSVYDIPEIIDDIKARHILEG
jgi:hypothetical protein